MMANNKPFYVKAAEQGSNSYHVMKRGAVNEWGDPWVEDPYLSWDYAVKSADELNKLHAAKQAQLVWAIKRRRAVDFIPSGDPLDYFMFDMTIAPEVHLPYLRNNREGARRNIVQIMRNRVPGWQNRVKFEREFINACTYMIDELETLLVKRARAGLEYKGHTLKLTPLGEVLIHRWELVDSVYMPGKRSIATVLEAMRIVREEHNGERYL